MFHLFSQQLISKLKKLVSIASHSSFIFKFVFALLAATLISSLKLDYLESYIYDYRVAIKAYLGLAKINQPNIAIVLIDSKTVEHLERNPNYKDHSFFLQELYKLDPRFVIYDFRAEKNELIDFDGTIADKKKFVDSAKKFADFYIATNDLEMKGTVGKLSLNTPLHELNFTSCPRTSDISLFARDGVSRRLMVSYQGQTMLQPIIASYYNANITDPRNIKGRFDVLDSEHVYINYHPQGTFPVYRFEDILNQKISPGLFKDQIVLVGMNTGRSSKDYAMTPYSREVTAMTSTELQANILQTLIDNNAPVKVPEPINIAITVLISMLTVYVVLALKPSRGLLIVGSTLFGIGLVGTILLAFFNIWIDLAHPFLAIFLCYYFFIPYRLIIENRRSWEYLQKNKLLHQVEELKTNFISMMSHDLKTPIARIQGMTEVILKDRNIILSPVQIEAVDTIKSSSDDLLKFINSILQYGRIESQGIELRRQAKDINQLLQDVINKHEFLAQVKKIKIVTELEPLFPVQVDSDLMRQVFSNLIENAIKYSPEDSTMLVRSREDGDRVLVEIIDNGMGIPAADLPNIFMKFFRSHNVKTSTIKGTGLGLYLAHYFVKLHKGEIDVISEIEKGSKFTVTLPLNP